jgi:phosphoglycerate dehydrogenase-like enzyme
MHSMQIVVVAGRVIDYAITPVVEALKRDGHAVTLYPDAASFRAADDPLAEADLLFGSGLAVDAALLAHAPRLRAVVTPWIGTESFDVKAATARGVVLANGQVPENYLSMAEATIMLILACLHNLPEKIEAMRANRPPPPRQEARMLKGKTLGMIGFGNMARAIAARLAAWDVTMQTYAPRLKAPLPEGVARVALDTLLETSDIVCVLATLNAETRGMLTLEKLRRMKPGAILINTARGGIVEETAICEIAKEGRLHKIALDVFETEPLPADSELRRLSNTILTPHCVGHSREGAEAVPVVALENIARALAGEPPLYVVNPDILPAWKKRWA